MLQSIAEGKDESMIVYQVEPFNAAPSLANLVETTITPTEQFFVRNHGAVPEIDPLTYAITIKGLIHESLHLTLADIQALAPFVRRTVTLQCAGNRRQDFDQAFVNEVPWGSNALSTATWGGVLLADVLAQLSIDPLAQHIEFIGLDTTHRHGEMTQFGASIPLDLVHQAAVLLAWEMNGAPLPSVHGGPLRVVVPSTIGARSVKWLESITLRHDPSPNYFQSKTYRLIGAEFDADEAIDQCPMLGEVPISSVICHPAEDAVFEAGPVVVRGYAIASGVERIERVEFSPDGGTTWLEATLQQEPQIGVWCLWEIVLNPSVGIYEWLVRASDSAGNTQPEHPQWNLKGYLNNAWDRRSVQIIA